MIVVIDIPKNAESFGRSTVVTLTMTKTNASAHCLRIYAGKTYEDTTPSNMKYLEGCIM